MMRIHPVAIVVALVMSAVVSHFPVPAAAESGTEYHVHGLLELIASERATATEFNRLTRGDSPFDAYGVHVLADARLGPRLGVFTHVVLRDATNPYVFGAYLMYTPWDERDIHVLAGKVPWLVGTFAPRAYSDKNPLIGTPLIYQHHSTLVWYAAPPSVDVLLATAGSGQYGVDYFGSPMSFGMPIVDDSYWDVGVTVTGSQRPFEFAAGVSAGTPGWGTTGLEENSGKSVLGRIGLSPVPGVRAGVSGAYGPYLVQSVGDFLPPGKEVGDYHQVLGMADLELLVGHAELRAEGAVNVWETPTVGDLRARGGYVELKYALSSGAFAAARFDAIRFGDVTPSVGEPRPWDADVTRGEAGIGYRFTRDVLGKVVYQQMKIEGEAGRTGARRFPLLGAQLSVKF